MSLMIPTIRIKFTAYKIRMVEGLLKFFEFEDLSFEFCGGFVAIGRRRGGKARRRLRVIVMVFFADFEVVYITDVKKCRF